MPTYRKEVDRRGIQEGPMRGTVVTWEWTYKAQDVAFHNAVTDYVENTFFPNFRRSYSRRAPERTGALRRGFQSRVLKRYGKPETVVVRWLRTTVRYAYIVEHGGRGRHHAGTRRAGHMRRIFGTERRKAVRFWRTNTIPRIYGTRR